MKIGKLLLMLLAMLVVSMFFFPFNFSAFPSQPTKNYLAVLGLLLAVFTFVSRGGLKIPNEVIVLLLLSLGVSVVAYIAIVFNRTPDYSYVYYIRTAVIWLSAAYAAVMAIYFVHGYVSVKLIIDYITAVCVFQCAMALLIEFVPAVKAFVDAHVSQGQALLDDLDRLYGIGAYLDVGGSRFALALVGIAAIMDAKLKDMKFYVLLIYGMSFVFIAVVGNMIARTAIIGVLFGLGLFVFRFFQNLFRPSGAPIGRLFGSLAVTLLLLTPVAITLYNAFPAFEELMRFGFEGFFNYFEGGEFETASTNTLKSMVVFPEDIKTWIIGDGYFANSRYDENYLGDSTTGGFYMGTDIGYLRFIFYGGLIFLLAMSSVLIYSGVICMNKFPKYKMLFLLEIGVNFTVWLKVATDTFLFFCLFICAVMIRESFMNGEDYDEEEDEDEEEWDEDDEEEDGEEDDDDDEEDEDEDEEGVRNFPLPSFRRI